VPTLRTLQSRSSRRQLQAAAASRQLQAAAASRQPCGQSRGRTRHATRAQYTWLWLTPSIITGLCDTKMAILDSYAGWLWQVAVADGYAG